MTETCTTLPEFVKIGKTYAFVEKIIGKDLNWSNMQEIYSTKGSDDTITLRIYEYNGINILEEEEMLEGYTVNECGFENWGIDYFAYYTQIQLINL